MIELQGQTAIVTGAGTGIGRETALLLAQRGAKILVNDPDAAAAQAVVDDIIAQNGIAAAETTPVGPDTAADIVRVAESHFGPVDILVNNAGISRPAPFGEDSDQDISDVFAVNLLGPYALMRAVWPSMKARQYGRILNTASSAALGSGIGAYAPTKAGIIGLTKEAAISGDKFGIRVNAIMPSAHTRLLDKHPDPTFRAWISEFFPTSYVAATSVYLVSSDVASNGELFSTGGGLVQRMTFFETEGVLDRELTPEKLADAFPQVFDPSMGQIITRQSDRAETTNRHFPR
jgi:NAD(P)-dependent dehydrogenase (short-subunit alcohol dehydrogenase family)